MRAATNYTTDTIQIARQLVRQRFAITPVAHGTKKPVLENWPNIRINESDIETFFGDRPTNLGVLLGEASGGLVDVDLDCHEAVTIAPYLLPTTDAIFGREGSPRSHWLYFCAIGPKQFLAPDTEAERATLVEIRSDGQQTVFPNSVHPSGENIRWDEQGSPVNVETQSLILAVEQLAARVYLHGTGPQGRDTRHQRRSQEHCYAVSGQKMRSGASLKPSAKQLTMKKRLQDCPTWRAPLKSSRRESQQQGSQRLLTILYRQCSIEYQVGCT